MTAAEALRLRLLELPAVTAIVGSRVYLLMFQQTQAWPAIRVSQVSEIEDYHLRGSIGLRRGRVQVDCVAATMAEASSLAAAVHGSYDGDGPTGLTGYRGTIGGMRIALIEAEGLRMLFDPDELAVVRISRDYGVHWREN